jgi:AraC family transcriptional regulator, regulatory protein of adaptative response / methylated-DNA-[protein]-cysteine methyltransferase
MADIATGENVFRDDDARWRAVVERNRAADGCFFYSVASTGVYCRPSCAARPARRENVRFHGTTAAAEQAGFRPCRRCRPDQPPLAERQAALVAAACREIEAAEQVPGLADLARSAGLSPYYFQRLFKAVAGVTPKAYAQAVRARRLDTELGRGDSVTDAMYDAGFNSSGRFYATSAQRLGMTPSDVRAGGAGVPIRLAAGQCSLGAIVVAATAKGICAILLGDDANELLSDLQQRFPGAQFVGGDSEFEQWVAAVVGFVEAPAVGLNLPLDIRGTAFQQRVWEALRAIPQGSTVGYAELAERVGLPGGARAVAQACAANAIAVAIPCHRVVRSDGALSGYRWGVERKRELLEREGAL